MSVNELAARIQVPSVTSGLGDYVQHDSSQVGKPPLAKEVRPETWFGIERRVSDDGVGSFNLLAVEIRKYALPKIGA